MGKLGGFGTLPLRLGGGKPRVKAILDGLVSDLGTAYDAANPDTIVYAETLAVARAIDAAWSTNMRLANVWNPLRCGLPILRRWERFLRLPQLPADTELARRQRAADCLSRFGKSPTGARITTLLAAALGSAFVATEYISYANANITVPDGTYPWGTPNADAPWSSTVARVLVRMQKPSTMTEAEFYAAAGMVYTILDPILPVWTSFDWYRPGTSSVNVSGGPSAGGFYFDSDANLDNQVYDV